MATAAARKGPALDRSGSTAASCAGTRPGATVHAPGDVSATSTSSARSTPTVIATCSGLGTVSPVCRSRRPRGTPAAASSAADRNWEEPEASTATSGTSPSGATVAASARVVIVKGRRPGSPSSTTATPSWRSASRTGAIGRRRAPASPSKRTRPGRSAATNGTKRMTVPASPQSTATSPASGAPTGIGCTRRPPSDRASNRAPSAVSAVRISAVSRDSRTPCRTHGPSARAASTRCRFVSDFDPGSRTSPRTGPCATGAGQVSAASGRGAGECAAARVGRVTGPAYPASVGRGRPVSGEYLERSWRSTGRPRTRVGAPVPLAADRSRRGAPHERRPADASLPDRRLARDEH